MSDQAQPQSGALRRSLHPHPLQDAGEGIRQRGAECKDVDHQASRILRRARSQTKGCVPGNPCDKGPAAAVNRGQAVPSQSELVSRRGVSLVPVELVHREVHRLFSHDAISYNLRQYRSSRDRRAMLVGIYKWKDGPWKIAALGSRDRGAKPRKLRLALFLKDEKGKAGACVAVAIEIRQGTMRGEPQGRRHTPP